MTGHEFRRWAAPFPDALMLVSREGRILASNAALSALLRVPSEVLATKTLFDFTPAGADAVHRALRLWAGSGQMVHGPAAVELPGVGRIQCEGALLRPLEPNAPVLLIVRAKHHEAATARFVALNQKIEQLSNEVRLRQRSEEEVRRQREWFQVTLSSIGDAVIATDVEGRVEFLNGAAEELTGWNQAEALGVPMDKVFDIFSEEHGGPVENPVHRVLSEGRVVGLANHTILRARNGIERPVEDSAAPIRDTQGRLIGVVLVFRDVSEKKKAQEKLSASERRFRLWTELNVVAAGVIDLAGNFLEANEALLNLLGYSHAELEAGTFSGKACTPPEFLERDLQALEEARRRGACHPYEKAYIHKDGHRVPVIIGYALFVEPKRYQHQQTDELALCFIVDISERKRAETLLEQRVAERTGHLQSALADLETFSYTISHDLRAPLRSMQTYAEITLDDFGAALPEEARGYLRRIIRSGGHLDALIHDVLTYARISNGSAPMGPVDLREVIAKVIERYPHIADAARGIDVAADLPVVMGNGALLTQCFANLIGNAVKFVPPDRAPVVTIRAETAGNPVRIGVQDNGIGIAPNDLARIFNIFERGATAASYAGTGIGLSIVRRAAEKMGGKVGVTSEPGQGSRFWVELHRPQETA